MDKAESIDDLRDKICKYRNNEYEQWAKKGQLYKIRCSFMYICFLKLHVTFGG